MPRKPTLSPSKITTYLACPVKYRWTYIDSRGKWFLRARSYYSFGSTLHRVLERFHNSNDGGVTTVDEALAAYEESWIDAGYSSAEEMAEAYGDGKLILERHLEESIKRPVSAQTLFVERQLRWDMGPFVLVGRLDRVDEHEDGSLEIVDYKTGRNDVTVEQVQTDLAMSCYQLLLGQKYPDRPIRASIVALRNGSSASYSMSQEERDEFSFDLLELGTHILNRSFEEIEPVYKPLLCQRCDFVPLCKRMGLEIPYEDSPAAP